MISSRTCPLRGLHKVLSMLEALQARRRQKEKFPPQNDNHSSMKPESISRPTGHHNVFTCFQTDSNFKICQMTKTTRSRCRTRPTNKCDVLHSTRELGESIAADHKVPNNEKESRHQQMYALIVQDASSYRIQSFSVRSKKRKRNIETLPACHASLQTTRESLHEYFFEIYFMPAKNTK